MIIIMLASVFLYLGNSENKNFLRLHIFLNDFYSLENEESFTWLFEITQLQTKMHFAWRQQSYYKYNNYMGSTDSHPANFRLQQDYRLVRRFISDFYCCEVTIVQHKQTRQQLALRQSVLQTNASDLKFKLQSRRALIHRNFISLYHFWIESDLGICSNLFKLHALFEYHENTLEDVINQKGVQSWSDAEVADFVRQMISALAFLENNGMVYLLQGPRSIAVLEDQSSPKINDDEIITERKALREIGQNQRCSLVDLKKANGVQLSKYRLTDLVRPTFKKRIYKLFQPLQGLTGTRSMINLQNQLQVPLHPFLANSSDHIISDHLVKLQNLFTVISLAIGLIEGSDSLEMNFSKNGRLSLDKLKVKIEQLKSTHPRTSCQLQRIGVAKTAKELQQLRGGETGMRLKQFSFARREGSVEIGRRDQRMRKAASRKRISLLQI